MLLRAVEIIDAQSHYLLSYMDECWMNVGGGNRGLTAPFCLLFLLLYSHLSFVLLTRLPNTYGRKVL